MKAYFGSTRAGSMKPRSNAKAVCYRLCYQSGIKNLLHRINGSIRNTGRVMQYKKLCEKFNIDYKNDALTSVAI